MDILALIFAAFGTSILGNMLGMGGGTFIVPVLTLWFGLDIHLAIGASLVSVIACSCSGATPLLKNRLVNIRLAVILEVATTVGALTGVLLIGILSASFLYGLFAAILFLSSWQILSRRREQTAGLPHPDSWATRLHLHDSYHDQATGKAHPYVVGPLPLGLSLMYAAGLVSALLGIGSGSLKIPAMDAALKLPIKISSATSNYMIGVTAAASACAYFMKGDIDIALTGPVVLGSVVGALLGANLLVRFPASRLRLFFAFVLILLASQMALTAAGVSLFGVTP